MKKRLFIFSLFLVLLFSVGYVDAVTPINFHCEQVNTGEQLVWEVTQSEPYECSCNSPGDGDGSGADCNGAQEVCGGCAGCEFGDEFGNECNYEDVQFCNTGEDGICSSGTRTCGICERWSECVRSEDPGSEICGNGEDDDCDGFTDFTDEDCSYGDCYISTTCGTNNPVFEVSGTSNAHIGLIEGTDYSYKVCCEASISRSDSDSVVRFSGGDNAHVQTEGQNPIYDIAVGFSGATCSVKSLCSAEEFCVFKFEDGLGTQNNAHVAECESSSYANSVCCVAEGDDSFVECTADLGGECDIDCGEDSLEYISGSDDCSDSCYSCVENTGSCDNNDGILNPEENCDLAMPEYDTLEGFECSEEFCTWVELGEECSEPEEGECGEGEIWDDDDCECVTDPEGPEGGSYSSACEGIFRIKESCSSCEEEDAPSDVCDGSVEGYREINYYKYALSGADPSDCSDATSNSYEDCTNPLTQENCWISDAEIQCFLTGEEVPFFDNLSLVFALLILTSYYVVSRKQKVL